MRFASPPSSTLKPLARASAPTTSPWRRASAEAPGRRQSQIGGRRGRRVAAPDVAGIGDAERPVGFLQGGNPADCCGDSLHHNLPSRARPGALRRLPTARRVGRGRARASRFASSLQALAGRARPPTPRRPRKATRPGPAAPRGGRRRRRGAGQLAGDVANIRKGSRGGILTGAGGARFNRRRCLVDPRDREPGRIIGVSRRGRHGTLRLPPAVLGSSCESVRNRMLTAGSFGKTVACEKPIVKSQQASGFRSNRGASSLRAKRSNPGCRRCPTITGLLRRFASRNDDSAWSNTARQRRAHPHIRCGRIVALIQ